MAIPLPQPPDSELGFIEWVIGIAWTAILVLGGLLWRASSKVTSMSSGIEQGDKAINDLRDGLKDIIRIGNERHEANLRVLRDIPTMAALNRLEDRMDKGFEELKRIMRPTT